MGVVKDWKIMMLFQANAQFQVYEFHFVTLGFHKLKFSCYFDNKFMIRTSTLSPSKILIWLQNPKNG